MVRKHIRIAVFCVVMLPAMLFAADADRAALEARNEALGNYNALVKTWMRIVSAEANTPRAAVILMRLGKFLNYLEDDKEVETALTAVLNGKLDRSEVRELIYETLFAVYVRRGQFDRAKNIITKLGVIRDWKIIGPFGVTDRSTFDIHYAPESEIDFKKTYTSYNRVLEWRDLPAPGISLDVNFFANESGNGAIYGLAVVDSDSSKKAVLRIVSGAAMKVWLNKDCVFVGDRFRKNIGRRRLIPVALSKGRNYLRVKVTSAGNAAFRLSFVDQAGCPLSGLTIRNEGQVDRNIKKTSLAAFPANADTAHTFFKERARALSGRLAAEKLSDKDKKKLARELAYTYAYLAFACSHQRLDDDAIHYMSTAASLMPDSPFFSYHLGEFFREARFLQAGERKNAALRAYEKTLKLDRTFAAAHLRIGEFLKIEGKPKEAIATIKKALKASPGFYVAMYRIANICFEAGWKNEARNWVQKIEADHPDFPLVPLFWGKFYLAAGNNERALSYYKKARLKNYAVPAITLLITRILKDNGDYKGAKAEYQALLKHNPSANTYLRQLALLNMRYRHYKDALAVYKKVLRNAAPNALQYEFLGNLYLKWGRRNEANMAYEKALSLRPGLHRVRRYLDYARNKKDDFAKPFKIDTKKALRDIPPHRLYPRASSIRFIDQMVAKVYRDGSWASVTHSAQYIYADKAKEDASELYLRGEFIDAKTYTPDGRVLEPIIVPGERKLTMPGVEPGAAVEYKNREDFGPRIDGKFSVPEFFYKSPSFDEPFWLSQYIIILPSDMDAEVVSRHLNVDKGVVYEVKDDPENHQKVHIWTTRKMPSVNREPFMPNNRDYLPYSYAASKADWGNTAALMKDYYLAFIQPTRLIQTTAKEVVKGGKNDREKLQALYRYIQRHIRPSISGRATSAHRILAGRSGNRNILFYTMAKAAGLDVKFLAARENTTVGYKPVWAVADESFFRYNLVLHVAEDGSKTYMTLQELFLPFEMDQDNYEIRFLPFGHIPCWLHGGMAFDFMDDQWQLMRIPAQPFENRREERSFTLDVAQDGSAAGRFTRIAYGEKGAFLRAVCDKKDDTKREAWLDKYVSKIIPGQQLISSKMTHAADAAGPFSVRASFSVARYARETGVKGTVVVKDFFEALELKSRYAPDNYRRYPMRLTKYDNFTEEIRVNLPEGVTPLALPKDFMHIGTFANYSLRFVRTAKGFVIKRSYKMKPQVIPPGRYQKFKAECQKIDTAEEFEVFLRYAKK